VGGGSGGGDGTVGWITVCGGSGGVGGGGCAQHIVAAQALNHSEAHLHSQYLLARGRILAQ
jgi:galactokinase